MEPNYTGEVPKIYGREHLVKFVDVNAALLTEVEAFEEQKLNIELGVRNLK